MGGETVIVGITNLTFGDDTFLVSIMRSALGPALSGVVETVADMMF